MTEPNYNITLKSFVEHMNEISLKGFDVRIEGKNGRTYLVIERVLY